MTVALTDLSLTQIYNDGNKLSKLYQMAASGVYVSGGHIINNAVFPGAVQTFKKFTRVYFDSGDNFDSAGFFLKIESIDNSDSSNPSCRLRVYELETGGTGFTEVTPGDNYINSDIRLVIEGVGKEGIISEPG